MLAPVGGLNQPSPFDDPWDNGQFPGGTIGNANAAANLAAWQERERRQRTVRLLMMFLLMLLLMDGEEQNERQRRYGNNGSLRYRNKKHPHLSQQLKDDKGFNPNVFISRWNQDEHLRQATQHHERYISLNKLNNGNNIDRDIRTWAIQQEQQSPLAESENKNNATTTNMSKSNGNSNNTTTSTSTTASPTAPNNNKDNPEDEVENRRKVYHYPWNATGFYRGEWKRVASIGGDSTFNSDTSSSSADITDKESVFSGKNNNSTNKYVQVKLIENDMQRILEKDDTPAGVFLIPDGQRIKPYSDGNTSIAELFHSPTDIEQQATIKLYQRQRIEQYKVKNSKKFGSGLLAKSRKKASKQLSHHSLFISNFRGGMDMDSVVSSADDDDDEEFDDKDSEEQRLIKQLEKEAEDEVLKKLTLTKDSGRVAFQFYSKVIPGMTEISLVNGFVKLYDSSTVGYSTRRDILLRVKGIIIHSIGRISLVSNVNDNDYYSRSIFVINKHHIDDENNEHIMKSQSPPSSTPKKPTSSSSLSSSNTTSITSTTTKTSSKTTRKGRKKRSTELQTDNINAKEKGNSQSSAEKMEEEINEKQRRHSRILKSISSLNNQGDSDTIKIEEIRDDVMALYPINDNIHAADAGGKSDTGNEWKILDPSSLLDDLLGKSSKRSSDNGRRRRMLEVLEVADEEETEEQESIGGNDGGSTDGQDIEEVKEKEYEKEYVGKKEETEIDEEEEEEEYDEHTDEDDDVEDNVEEVDNDEEQSGLSISEEAIENEESHQDLPVPEQQTSRSQKSTNKVRGTRKKAASKKLLRKATTKKASATTKKKIAKRMKSSMGSSKTKQAIKTLTRDEYYMQSDSIIPYPFIIDDESNTIAKMKTPASRKMPPRELMLEANAGACEFELNFNVQEIQWTIGEWRNLISNRVRESNMLNPILHEDDEDQSTDHNTKENDENSDESKTPPTPKPTPAPFSIMSRKEARERYLKRVRDQAVVMEIVGTINSQNCNFTAEVNATAIRTNTENLQSKAMNYSFYMMLTCLTQIVVLLRQLLHSQSQSAATRVSLFCVGWQTVLDALFCLGHISLSLAMAHDLFWAFATVAFFKLLIFCVIEMKYMAIIMQARNNSNGGQNTTELLRRQITMLHLRFYVALMAVLIAFFYAGDEYRTPFVVVLYSFWLPQIILNIVTEAKRPLHNYYIYGMSITRLIAPLYIFAVKNNFLREVYQKDAPHNPLMCQLLVLWVGIQAAILLAQAKYGARFMIPARFLPPKFDYSRPIPESMLPPGVVQGDVDQDSSLVNEGDKVEVQTLLDSDNNGSSGRHKTTTRNRMKGSRSKRDRSPPTPITQTNPMATSQSATRQSNTTTETADTSGSNNNSNNQCTLDCVICYNPIDIHNRRGYMLAPCDHIFHKDCLAQWMEVKMECPICRTELPSL